MDTKTLLLEAFRRSAWNPEFPGTMSLDSDRVSKMDGTESDAKQLLRSFQLSDANYSGIAFAIHGRPAQYDGEPGPATEKLAELRANPQLSCPMPDHPPPPGSSFHYDDPELQKAVESMQRHEAMGSGSWPSCDPQSPNVNSFRVRIDITNCPSTVRAYLDKALAEVVKCYAEMGCALRYILATSGDCEIQKLFQRLSGSVIGWNEFPNPNTCNQVIDGRLSTTYTPSDWRYWANLEAHETGHGVGLQHTRGHIMNPSILLVWPLSWKGGPSESTMARYFGGVPITPPGTTPTQRPTVSGEVRGYQTSTGNIAIEGKPRVVVAPNQPAGVFDFILVPGSSNDKFRFEPSSDQA